MIRRVGVVAYVLVSFMAVGAAALQVSVPKTTVLGDAFAVRLGEAPGIAAMRVDLVDWHGNVVGASRGFAVDRPDGRREWVALVGVPTTIIPGTYHLRAAVQTAQGVVRSSAPIVVEGRPFHHENIHLDGALTHLQTEETIAKQRQAALLWRILTRFSPHAVYQAGPLIVPVARYFVSAPFAERRDFVFARGGSEPSIHQGIDLAVPAGTPVRAASSGKVEFAGPLIMTGNTVVIEQLPEVYSLYFHMERLLVHAGEEVKQGATIGLVGSTGLATGPHLHWQVEVDGVAVDPMSLLAHGLVPPAAPAGALR